MEYFRQRFTAYLDEGEPVTIAGFTWQNSDVFRTMGANDYDAHFVDWVGEKKAEAKDRARDFLLEYGSLERFNTMMGRHRNGYVVPFVGAGMSIASGYPFWGQFLSNLLNDVPEIKADVEGLLALGKYEEAAQLAFDTLQGGAFDEEIHNAMGSHRRATNGPVGLMPNLFPNEVFSTNLDYVLNHVYEASDNAFAREFRGAQLRQAAQRMANNPHCLLRLHGEADTADDRVLTRQEYDAIYADITGLANALANLVGIRSLLFMGCSLETDRTVNAFREIRNTANGAAVRHYAFLPFPGTRKRAQRREQLGEAEIHPIYYPAKQHDQSIEDLMITMIDGGFDD